MHKSTTTPKPISSSMCKYTPGCEYTGSTLSHSIINSLGRCITYSESYYLTLDHYDDVHTSVCHLRGGTDPIPLHS